MVVIIAEKPSLAKNIVAGIGKMDKMNGFYKNDEYIVTWVFGHFFSLADIESYSGLESGAKWTLDILPCFPEKFRFEIKKGVDKKSADAGIQRQFKIISDLINRNDVDTIVNAGDADREGEIIVRLCVENALKTKKTLKRLWLPDQTPETVAAALSDMKDEAHYDNLANEGYARTFIDWLYGVNLTRYATIKTGGKLLRVGRVIVPIVKAIYERDMEIKNFVPETYYQLLSAEDTKGEKIELLGKQKFAKNELNEANTLAEKYNASKATVTSVKKKRAPVLPGKLYSLSTVQNVLGKKYKMSMEDSLATIQKLYEAGYLTYPRTNSEYLATAEKDKIRTILGGVAKLGYPVKFKDSKSIFDDSKIESHSALTPTYKIPDKDKLSEKERQVYSTILRRFVAVFCAEECIADKSEIKIQVGDFEEFTLKGTVMVSPGWTKYDDYTGKDKVLPNLSEGDEVNIAFAPSEKQTTPPKHYTIETLNNYLKNPFKDDKAKAKELEENGEVDDALDYKAIFEGLELGTEATRTGIIDNAKKSGYIDLRKDVYTILDGGEYLIRSLSSLGITMDKYKTSELGKALKSVYRGEMSVDSAVKLAEKEINEIFENGKRNAPKLAPPENTGSLGEIIGICPLCGKNVIRGKQSYGCMGYTDGCEFRVNVNILKRDISKHEMARLLATGKTSLIRGFISRNGKKFDAYLELRDGKAEFAFQNQSTTKTQEKTNIKAKTTRTKKQSTKTK